MFFCFGAAYFSGFLTNSQALTVVTTYNRTHPSGSHNPLAQGQMFNVYKICNPTLNYIGTESAQTLQRGLYGLIWTDIPKRPIL